MKCSNCGAEVKEHVSFCDVCGQPVGENTAAQNSSMEHEQGKRKKSKAPLFACIAVLAVAIIGVAAFAMPKIRKAFMKPAAYMQYAEEKSRDKGSDRIETYFEQLKSAYSLSDGSRKSSIQIVIPDEIKTMLQSYISQLPDLSKLKDISIDTESGEKDGAAQSDFTLKANGESLLTAKMYTDFAGKKLYYQIPELSSAYLDASASVEESAVGGTADMFEIIKSMQSGQYMPGAEDAGKIYKRYTDILIQSLKHVKKKKNQTCEAEGVSGKADLYIATYEGKEATELLKKFINTLKDDKEIFNYLEKTGVDKEEFQDDLKEALEDLENRKEEKAYLTFSDYISGEEIIGREIKVYEEKDAAEPEGVIQMFLPRERDKAGFLFYVEMRSEEILKVAGSGTLSGMVFDGEFSVECPKLMEEAGQMTSGEVLHIKVSDYDLKKARTEGTGTLEITMPGVAQLAAFKVVMEPGGTIENAKVKMDISMGEQKLCTLNISNSRGKSMEIHEPGSGDVIYDTTKEGDMIQYLTEMDTEGVLNHITDTTGIDMKSLISMLGGGDITNMVPGMSADGTADLFMAEPQ